MTNHVHLLVTPGHEESLPGMMQSLGWRYVRYVNWTYRRTGALWEGRYRAAPIDSDTYFLSCCRYIELDPVRARMASHPRDCLWSSYRAHAYGEKDALLSDHPLYRGLGRSAAERQKAYRELFRARLADDFLDAVRAATNGGWALGDDKFKRQIARALGRRFSPLSKGRPPKDGKDKRQLTSALNIGYPHSSKARLSGLAFSVRTGTPRLGGLSERHFRVCFSFDRKAIRAISRTAQLHQRRYR
jgi:putative transposase